jgi:hypothetical protein
MLSLMICFFPKEKGIFSANIEIFDKRPKGTNKKVKKARSKSILKKLKPFPIPSKPHIRES